MRRGPYKRRSSSSSRYHPRRQCTVRIRKISRCVRVVVYHLATPYRIANIDRRECEIRKKHWGYKTITRFFLYKRRIQKTIACFSLYEKRIQNRVDYEDEGEYAVIISKTAESTTRPLPLLLFKYFFSERHYIAYFYITRNEILEIYGETREAAKPRSRKNYSARIRTLQPCTYSWMTNARVCLRKMSP